MDIGTVITWAGFALTIITNLVTLAFGSGVILSRVNNSEKMIEDLKDDVKEMRSLREEMAGVKAQLIYIASTLIELKLELAKE